MSEDNDGRCTENAAEMSRRDFAKSAVGMGVTLSVAGTVLGVAGPSIAQSPKRGGRMKVAFKTGSPKDTADPARSGHAGDHARMFQLYNGLTSTGSDLKPVGDLAESWEVNKDADEWIFKLRKGVTFHNGKTLEARDAVYSLRRILDPAVGSPHRSAMGDIDGNEMKALDATTVRIKLTRPNADLPAILASYHTGIIPDGFTDFDKAVGTGPYKLKSFKPGLVTTLSRNENYRKTGRPYLDEIETSSVPDPVARVNALLSGEFHLVEALDAKLAEQVQKSSTALPFRSKSGYHTHLIMQVNQPPFNNPDVRMALKLLADRQRTLDLVYNGFGHIGNDQPISAVYPFYCDKIPQRAYDPAAAKELLKKAGQSNLKLELFCSDANPGGVELASIYRETAAAGGVDVQVLRQPAQGYWNAIWMKKPFSTGSWNMRATAGIFLSTVYQSDATWNETVWKRADFDNLLGQASKTIDNAKRAELYCQLQAMVSNDGGAIIPTFIDLLDGVSRKLKGLKPYPTGAMGGWQWEDVWLDA